MKVPLFARVIPIYAVLLLVLVTPSLSNKKTQGDAIHDGTNANFRLTVHAKQITQKPVGSNSSRIVVPAVGIDLNVFSHDFNSSKGTPFIYGYWTKDIFGPTDNLKFGDTAHVNTTNGHIFEYKYLSSSINAPANTKVINNNDLCAPTLRLMMCYGTWVQQRLIAVFKLEIAS